MVRTAKIYSNTFSPHSCTPFRFGFFPKATSKAVIPSTALVVVQFNNHTTCWAASLQKFFGSLPACKSAWSSLQLSCYGAQWLHVMDQIVMYHISLQLCSDVSDVLGHTVTLSHCHNTPPYSHSGHSIIFTLLRSICSICSMICATILGFVATQLSFVIFHSCG